MIFTCLPILFGCITFMCPYSYLPLSASSDAYKLSRSDYNAPKRLELDSNYTAH